MEDTTQPSKLENPKVPPLILGVGSALWKGIAAWGNVDFILSMREERLAMIFQSLLDYGWVILALVGVIWFFSVRKREPKGVHWGMVTSVGILAFMFGVLVTAYSSGSVNY